MEWWVSKAAASITSLTIDLTYPNAIIASCSPPHSPRSRANALGLQMAKMSGNAALGMCRMEFFQDIYTNGETVALPTSTVDGYQYALDELIFAARPNTHPSL